MKKNEHAHSGLMHEMQAMAEQFTAVGRALLTVVISPSGECLSANENCLNTLGLSRQELVGRNILDVFGLLLVPGELGKIRSRLRMGGSHSLRLRWPRCDGRVVQLDAWLVPLFDDDKKISQTMLFAADVTVRVGHERRKLERYRQLAQASDRSGRAVVITDADFAARYANLSQTVLKPAQQLPQSKPKAKRLFFSCEHLHKNIADIIFILFPILQNLLIEDGSIEIEG